MDVPRGQAAPPALKKTLTTMVETLSPLSPLVKEAVREGVQDMLNESAGQ